MEKKYKIIKDFFLRHKTVLENFSYLSLLQVINLTIPLLTYPYLIRTLGTEKYGLVIFAQAVMGYLVILISFGFNISATKEISLHRDSKKKLGEIVSTVLFIKGALMLIALSITSILVFYLPQAKEHKQLFLLTFWMCLYEVLFPIWYFQGIEKMKYITFITLFARLTFLSLVFNFITGPSDYLLIPILNGTGAILAGLYALYIIFFQHEIKMILPPLNLIKKHLRESSIIFTSRVSALKDHTPVFLIGLFIGNSAVAYYDLANKIITIINSVFDNVTNVMFPTIAKNQDAPLNKKIIKLEFIALTLTYLGLIFFGYFIVITLGGKEMLPANQILYILGLLLLRPLSSYIGTTILVSNNLSKQFSLNLVYSTLFYFSLIIGLYLADLINLYSMATTIVIALFFELGHRIYIIKKNNLINWLF